MAQNACDCPTPPGGRVVCEFAICRVEGGHVHSECHDIPSSLQEVMTSFDPHIIRTQSIGTGSHHKLASSSSHSRFSWNTSIYVGGWQLC